MIPNSRGKKKTNMGIHSILFTRIRSKNTGEVNTSNIDFQSPPSFFMTAMGNTILRDRLMAFPILTSKIAGGRKINVQGGLRNDLIAYGSLTFCQSLEYVPPQSTPTGAE